MQAIGEDFGKAETLVDEISRSIREQSVASVVIASQVEQIAQMAK